MFNPVILSIPALVLPLVLPPPAPCQFERLGNPAEDANAVVAFEAAVQDYVALHRRLERVWPPEFLLTDPEQAEMAAEILRTALREARPNAAQGGLFTPAVADVFRFRIAEAMEEGEYWHAVMAWPPDGADDADRWQPEVNQPIPWGVTAVRWSSLPMLPALPPEVAFRFIGRDLVLVDVHANLIVDILDHALPIAAVMEEKEAPVLPMNGDFEGCRAE
jgi:hypothetical protein